MIRIKLRVLLLGLAMIGALVTGSGLTGLTDHTVGQGKVAVAHVVGSAVDEQTADAATGRVVYDYGLDRKVVKYLYSYRVYLGGGWYKGYLGYYTYAGYYKTDVFTYYQYASGNIESL